MTTASPVPSAASAPAPAADHKKSTKRNSISNKPHNKHNTTPPNPYTGITPSHIAKTKLNEIYNALPDKDLAAVARTYTSRLHQLRLQREHRRSTHLRLTRASTSATGDEQYLPASCVFRFELGASPAAQAREEYVALKQKVDSTLQHCQATLAKSIGELQVLEMKIKQDEIAKTFCEGLAKIGIAFINYHRDQPSSKAGVAKTIQSQRLADRLVELLLDKNVDILEFSYLLEEEQSSADDNNNNKKGKGEKPKGNTSNKAAQPAIVTTNTVLKLYYKQIGRPMPTHSRQQNRDEKSSPYNADHTVFLKAILQAFENIVEPCFNSAWKDYLLARDKINSGEITKEEDGEAVGAVPVPATAQHAPGKETKPKATKTPVAEAAVLVNKNSNNSSTINRPTEEKSSAAAAIPTSEVLKEMVQMAVSEETQALRGIIRHLEEQVQLNASGHSLQQRQKAGKAVANTGTATTAATSSAAAANAKQETSPKSGDGGANKKGKRQRNRNNKKKNDTIVKETVKESSRDAEGENIKDKTKPAPTAVTAAKQNGTASSSKEKVTNSKRAATATKDAGNVDVEDKSETATNGMSKNRNGKQDKGVAKKTSGGPASGSVTKVTTETNNDSNSGTSSDRKENGKTAVPSGDSDKKIAPANGGSNNAKESTEDDKPASGNSSGNQVHGKDNKKQNGKREENNQQEENKAACSGEKVPANESDKAKGSPPLVTTENSMHDSTTMLFGSYQSAGDKKWD